VGARYDIFMRYTTDYIRLLIGDGKKHSFYCSEVWRRIAAEVRKLDNNECQICKAKGRHRRGEIVHHVKHLKDRPDLAMSIYDPVTGERQLITVCKQCHEDAHPENMVISSKKDRFTNDERW